MPFNQLFKNILKGLTGKIALQLPYAKKMSYLPRLKIPVKLGEDFLSLYFH
jgi:hypothetical protein